MSAELYVAVIRSWGFFWVPAAVIRCPSPPLIWPRIAPKARPAQIRGGVFSLVEAGDPVAERPYAPAHRIPCQRLPLRCRRPLLDRQGPAMLAAALRGFKYPAHFFGRDPRRRRAGHQPRQVSPFCLRPAPRDPSGRCRPFQEIFPRSVGGCLSRGGDLPHEIGRGRARRQSDPATLMVRAVLLPHAAAHERFLAHRAARQETQRDALQFPLLRGPGCRARPPQQSIRLLLGKPGREPHKFFQRRCFPPHRRVPAFAIGRAAPPSAAHVSIMLHTEAGTVSRH